MTSSAWCHRSDTYSIYSIPNSLTFLCLFGTTPSFKQDTHTHKKTCPLKPLGPTQGAAQTAGPTQGCYPLTAGPTHGCCPLTAGPTQGCCPLTVGPTQGCCPLTAGPTQGCYPLTAGPTQGCCPLTPLRFSNWHSLCMTYANICERVHTSAANTLSLHKQCLGFYRWRTQDFLPQEQAVHIKLMHNTWALFTKVTHTKSTSCPYQANAQHMSPVHKGYTHKKQNYVWWPYEPMQNDNWSCYVNQTCFPV